MKKIIKYEAFNGKLFDNENDCHNYEYITKAITELKESSGLYNIDSSGYIPNSGKWYTLAYRLGIDILSTYYKDKTDWIEMWKNNPSGIIGRFLEDSSNPVSTLYSFIICFDKYGNLWRQPYYANLSDTKGIEYASKN